MTPDTFQISTIKVRPMLQSNNLAGARRRTLPAVAFVLQQPRDYRKLAAIAEMLETSEQIYIVDDYFKNGRFSAACIKLLRDHGVACQLASHVLEADSQFAVGIYQANTWRKSVDYSREFVPLWLWRRYREDRLSWQTARDVLTGIALRIADRIGVRLQRLTGRFQGRHVGPSDIPDGVNAYADADEKRDGQRTRGGEAEAGRWRPYVATSALRQVKEAGKALGRQVLIPVPLARDLSRVSVLAPPYSDDVTSSFPEAHIRDAFDAYLTATDRQREAVERAVGERAETIGYPQYWTAQAIGQPQEQLRRHLDLDAESRIIAWLPLSGAGLVEQIDYLQPLTGAFTVVLRPHPDLYLPESADRRRAVQEHAQARGLLMQDSRSTEAGLLVRGADLVIAEGVSSLLSSLYLGARVAVGLDPLKPKFRRWDTKAGAGLAGLVSIDSSEWSSGELTNLLMQPAWWSYVETASDRVRRDFFGEIKPADVGRKRCAGALQRLAAEAELQP